MRLNPRSQGGRHGGATDSATVWMQAAAECILRTMEETRDAPQAEFVKEMRVAAALLWYSQGEIWQSKAAEIAGTSRAEFIDELSHRRIPVVQVTPEELQDEIDRE